MWRMRCRIINKDCMKKTNFRGICLALSFAFMAQGMAQSPEDGWQILFNGKDLTGWRELNGKHKWGAKGGLVIGTAVHGQPHGFLWTEAGYGDFIRQLEGWIATLIDNPGVQFPSPRTADFFKCPETGR